MEHANINNGILPELIVFAGPNGSGKSTFTTPQWIKGDYINADAIKSVLHCGDLEAAILAENARNELISNKKDLTFETVLSTRRNLDLMLKAKQEGYFIRGYFILTKFAELNIARVKHRVLSGGHDVPKEKIVDRYYKALKNIPEFIDLCDICHIYDNTAEPFRILRKHKTEINIYSNSFWTKKEIESLAGLRHV